MTVQFSAAVRNAMLDSIETTIGVTAKLRILSGAPPATCATAQSGTLLVEYTMASDWASAAAAGVKALSSLPLSSTGLAAGTAGYYRFVDNAGTTCHEQGTVGTSGTDMIIDNAVIAISQTVQVTAFSKTAPGA